jgi:hypothetical protein
MPKIFISFSTYDGNDIAKFVYKFCKKKGFDVFYSEKEIPSGNEWEQEIKKHLEKCDIFLFIATPDALDSEQVAKEVSEAKRLKKRIIPCKHSEINWSDLKKLGIDSIQGIEFDTKEDLMRKIGPLLDTEFRVITDRSPHKDTLQYETGLTSTSNWWLTREIKKCLDDASELEKGLPPHPTYIVPWMFKVDSFLKEAFGENSRYHQFFPKIMPSEISDASVADANYINYFREAKEHLQAILRDLSEDNDNNRK